MLRALGHHLSLFEKLSIKILSMWGQAVRVLHTEEDAAGRLVKFLGGGRLVKFLEGRGRPMTFSLDGGS